MPVKTFAGGTFGDVVIREVNREQRLVGCEAAAEVVDSAGTESVVSQLQILQTTKTRPKLTDPI